MRIGNVTVSLACIMTLLLSGCFDSGTGGGGASSQGRIHLVPAISGGAGLAKVGPSGASGLESFQVAVANISLAQDLTTTGSGWSNITGVLPLYTNQAMGDHNVVDDATARDTAWRSNYIDFCDPASIGRIASSQPFTAREIGDYNWVVVNWAPYFKVRATLPVDGDTVYTHDGPITTHHYEHNSGPDNNYYITNPATSMLTGPSEDAVVHKNNGGTWFRFLRPLHLTEADLDSNTTIADTTGRDSLGHPITVMIPSGKWNVLLVFNPQDLLFAGVHDLSNSSIQGDIMAADSSAYVHVPFLKATAVPYREGEAVMRETYEFSVTIDKAWARGTYGMRLELYLIGDNVVAVTVNSYPTDGTLAPPEVPVIFFANEKSDHSLSLEGYDHGAVFDGFVRKTAVGEEGTVPWNAGGVDDVPQTLTYRLVDIRRMN